MTEVLLAVDVLCDWLGYEPAYRVYVDDDLLTERTYIWGNRYEYVREHLSVLLEPGQHTLVVEPVKNQASQSQFTLLNFTINNQPAELVNHTFTI
jgi:hypothetical protein